jgi:hypothetical protein
MAYNNTYGLQAISQEVYEQAMHTFNKPGGCRDMALTCQALATQSDPYGSGNNVTVNDACAKAYNYCFTEVHGPYSVSNVRHFFDIKSVSQILYANIILAGCI